MRSALRALFTRARPLKTVWRIAKAGRTSVLAGTAHFFPYQFRESLRGLAAGAGTVLLEGPLDDAAMARVVESGAARERGQSLAGALDALAVTVRVFPNYCESVLDRRDPILHERMRPHLERGNAVAFIGILHCPRIIDLLRADGWEIAPASGS